MGAEIAVRGRGKWRVYFNNHADAPVCWSVDLGSIASEVKVRAVVIEGATSFSRVNLSRDNVTEPRAWFELEGTLTIAGGIAIFGA